jgi:ABC-type sugar transport system ATPase subunit
VTRPAGDFPIGIRQMIEIGKAVGRQARIVVMDEPTSALNANEAERLFERIAELRTRGCAIVYITHKMEEIERLADRITVLRDGRPSAPPRRRTCR